jgi:hypothetical protein
MNKDEMRNLCNELLAEFYLVSRHDRNLIKRMVSQRIGWYPEAADMDYMTYSCLADIERILTGQLNALPNEVSKVKERQRKLVEFEKDKNYVRKYVLEATKSFCRKKRYYWDHGKNKPDLEKGEKHKERKAGRAARTHFSGDENQVDDWLSSIAASDLDMQSFHHDTIQELDDFLKESGLNDKKIRCFWNRLEGMTFVEMAEQGATAASPDKYRKRYKRLLAQLESRSETFKEILMQDFG